MRRLIVSGALPAGSKISSVREMATGLAINPSTTSARIASLKPRDTSVPSPEKEALSARDEAEALRRSELLGKFDELVTELDYIGVTKQMLSQRLKGELKND